ncbi:hypothetical protein K353_03450 [Kitasatospora sp. SolWspMP-SS2h]|uniref:hypothetical protein n=1 Tax=Kitasatospora sp. SolWspMP-SS2h TaxID=1305729 RepID=UPI000DBAA4A1|nr:hypothetical protein [Kitasatospora sp. SolWspMP-SS2h]RAJ39962.1 hypothetical protein K353_03450 [Kitasatospora sp. SolWspMP-SS2h]
MRAEAAGSYPIVTDGARNVQIERNGFDGAWNKGEGGNGYLRGSRVWDFLYACNLGRDLRHFTFRWSASGNVAFRNDLDSDLNLHGGWEYGSLFERNILRVPCEHRSGSCRVDCGGEGGGIEEGRWYPVWWAAGPKAVRWFGSSGPQNVLHDNRMLKQTSRGGVYEPYAPCGTGPGAAFQFGSAEGAPGRLQPLGQGGRAIPDWGGREGLDYAGRGVVPVDVGWRSSLFLRDTDGLGPRDSRTRRVATWNIQGAHAPENNGSRYTNGLPRL